MKKFGILVFVIAIVLGVFVSSFFSFGSVEQKFFSFSFNKKIKGSGNVVTEPRDIGVFKGIDVSGVFEVEITAQKDFNVEIEADDNLIPLIKTEVRDGVLHIESEQRISTKNGLKVRVFAPDISQIDASGASKVSLSGIRNGVLRVDTSGASMLEIDGETEKLTINVSGASSINAEDLTAVAADVDASGASKVNVFATDDLRSKASGASKILYSGSPQNIDKRSSGASTIREK